jgi:hypothetical protein
MSNNSVHTGNGNYGESSLHGESYTKDGDSSTDSKFLDDTEDVFNELYRLLISKHKDYGPTNISKSPGGPVNGLRVRMWDKFARINHLIDSGKGPQNESLEDSFKDMANYAIIGLLVLRGQWPND